MSVTIQLEHPEVDIPQGAVIIPQVPGDRRFNAWARQVALKGWEKEQAVVYFYVDEMVPPVLGLRRRMSKWLDAGGFLHQQPSLPSSTFCYFLLLFPGGWLLP